MKINEEVEVFKCGTRSTNEEHVGYLVENCNGLSYHTTNNFDRRHSQCLMYARRYRGAQAKDKWKDPRWKGCKWICQGNRSRDWESMEKSKSLSDDSDSKI